MLGRFEFLLSKTKIKVSVSDKNKNEATSSILKNLFEKLKKKTVVRNILEFRIIS